MEEHEFTEEENSEFAGLIRNIKIMAVLMAAAGVSNLVQSTTSGNFYFSIAEGIAFLAMAVVFYLPTGNFRRIIETEGKDITELMGGFDKMRKGWLLLNIVTAVVVLLRISLLIDQIRILS